MIATLRPLVYQTLPAMLQSRHGAITSTIGRRMKSLRTVMLFVNMGFFSLAFLGNFMALVTAGMGHGPKHSFSQVTGEFLPFYAFFGFMMFYFAVQPRGFIFVGVGTTAIAWVAFSC